MFADSSEKEITVDGQVVTIRRLTGLEWIALARLAREGKTDEADEFALLHGLVRWPSERPITADSIAQLDAVVRPALLEEVYRHTKPSLYLTPAAAETERKNDSGGSPMPSTGTTEPPVSGHESQP